MTYLANVQPNRQLVPLDIVAPGSKGLNTVQSGQLMDPSYAVTATNAVIDTAGRLAARAGAIGLTLTPLANITVTNEVDATGNGTQTGFAWNLAFRNVVASSVTITAGTVTATDNGSGQLTGTGVSSGTINYLSGAVAITFTAAVPNLTQIKTTYQYTPAIKTIFEYASGNNTFQTLVFWDGGASNNLQNPGGAGSIAGTASLTNGRWYCQNFNNKMITFQVGQKPCVYSAGTPQLNTVVESSGTWPLSSGVGACCFGRVWSVSQSDGQTITYSDLLDETAVGTAGAGVINMANIWSDGTDTVMAIFAFNASLVVCGLRHIVFFTDGRGSMVGIDPTQAYVFDIVMGTGCLSQWSVAQIGETDVALLSPNGVQSLSRLTQDRSNPTYTLTKYIRDTMLTQLASEVLANISATFNKLTGFYILGFPVNNIVWCLDMRRRYTDDVGNLCSIITTWNMTLTTCCTQQLSQNLLLARQAGTVAQYAGTNDQGVSYNYLYLSPWMSFAQQGGPQVSTHLKMIKRFEAIIFAGGTTTINLTWGTDFSNTPNTAAITFTAGTNSQYGIGQYGISQYGGAAGTAIVKYDSRGRGQYYQLGVNLIVVGAFSLQQMQVATKLGRIA